MSLNDIVQHAITIYLPRCQASGIKMLSSLLSLLRLLRRREMMQVIWNLLANPSTLFLPGTIYIDVNDLETEQQGALARQGHIRITEHFYYCPWEA
jgi:signal transduction histidine kinase